MLHSLRRLGTARSLVIWIGVALATLILAVLVAPHVGAPTSGHGLSQLIPGLPLLGMGMIRVYSPILSAEQLVARVNPPAGSFETFPDMKFDTQLYPAAGVQSLNFFAQVANDPTITNMTQPGMLPAPDWLQLEAIQVTPYVGLPSNRAVTAAPGNQVGVLNDWSTLVDTGRAILTLFISNKKYGPWRVKAHHGIGGALGFITQGITAAAAAVGAQQTMQNGPSDNGFGPQGELVIAPTTPFSVTLQFAGAPPITSDGTFFIGVELVGRTYRAPR